MPLAQLFDRSPIQSGIRQQSLGSRSRFGRATELVFVLATGTMLVLGNQAKAQTWDGDTNTDWATGTNWNANAAPLAGANVNVNGAGGVNANPTIGANTPGYALTTISGGTVTVNAVLNSTGVIISGTGALTVNALGGVTGSVQVDTDGTLTNNGTITGSLIINAGTNSNGGVVTGSTAVNGGTLTLAPGTNLADAQTVSVTGTGTLTVDAADTVGGLTQSGGTIAGAATLTAASFLQTGGDMAGSLSVAGAKTLNGGIISGTLGGAGETTIQTGTTSLTGTISGGTTVTSGGILSVAGGSVTGDLTMSGGTLRATSDTTLSPPNLRFAAPTTNTVLAESGDTLTLSPGSVTFDLNTVTTFGSATDTGTVVLNASIIGVSSRSDVVVAGGTLRTSSNALLSNSFGFLVDRDVTVESGATLDLTGGGSIPFRTWPEAARSHVLWRASARSLSNRRPAPLSRA